MSAAGLAFAPSSVEPERLAAYSRLLSEVFGASPKFEPDAIAWRYRDNPVGEVVGADAWDGERLAAHYVTCPLQAQVGDRTLTGLLSLNTATHPDYQGRGLFTALAEQTYARAAEQGYAFVIGVANANSTPGFLRKLAFQLVAPLEAGLLLRDPRRFTEASCQFRAHWTDEAWRWRLANPAGRYALARSGELTGVWAATGTPLLRCAAFLPGRANVGGRRPLGGSLFIGLEPRLELSARGFVPIPRKLRPSPLNMIWRPLSGDAPATLDADRVALSFLDFDPY